MELNFWGKTKTDVNVLFWLVRGPECDEHPLIPFPLKAGTAAAYAGLVTGSWPTVPLAAATTALVEAGIRQFDPYAGICKRPD